MGWCDFLTYSNLNAIALLIHSIPHIGFFIA